MKPEFPRPITEDTFSIRTYLRTLLPSTTYGEEPPLRSTDRTEHNQKTLSRLGVLVKNVCQHLYSSTTYSFTGSTFVPSESIHDTQPFGPSYFPLFSSTLIVPNSLRPPSVDDGYRLKRTRLMMIETINQPPLLQNRCQSPYDRFGSGRKERDET